MDRNEDFAFLVKILAEPAGDGPHARPIPQQRLAALLISPTTRAAFNALRKMPSAPANDDYIFKSESFAADDGNDRWELTEPLEFKAPFGTLTVRLGPDEKVPYILALQLDPHIPGGIVARHVTVWETQTNQVWLDGLTDEAGELLASWSLGLVRPSHRLRDPNKLCLALHEETSP